MRTLYVLILLVVVALLAGRGAQAQTAGAPDVSRLDLQPLGLPGTWVPVLSSYFASPDLSGTASAIPPTTPQATTQIDQLAQVAFSEDELGQTWVVQEGEQHEMIALDLTATTTLYVWQEGEGQQASLMGEGYEFLHYMIEQEGHLNAMAHTARSEGGRIRVTQRGSYNVARIEQ